jgi:outer membrane protein
MNNNRILIVVLILFSISMGFCIWAKMSIPKVAYVRSADLVEGYIGMKEAKNLYKDKVAKWQTNVDTLKSDYEISINKYNMDMPRLSQSQKVEREELLKKQEINIRQYMSVLEQKAQEEDTKITQGVLNQINSYMKNYGEDNGYDLVLGLTIHGNVLYGKDAIDITDDVLKGLNDSYKSTGKSE